MLWSRILTTVKNWKGEKRRKILVTLWQQTLAYSLIKLCCVFILFFQEADQVWSPTDDGQTTGMITKNWITQIRVN